MPGLRYHRLDLHTHTPASRCYLDKSHTPEQIVQAALDRNLSAIAVTDHNAAGWIDKMKRAAKDTGLVIFPGVEISMNEGFHLVALLDPGADQRDVESLLGAIDIEPGLYGSQDALCTLSAYQVIDKIHERGGLAILAHIDAPKGAFFEQRQQLENGKIRVPINCSKLFNEAHYDAVECRDGRLPDGFDQEHQFKRFPAYYQASDNPDPVQPSRHSLDGLGTYYSWFKMDQINLEGLRQCFADPEVRIRLMGQLHEVGYPKIVRMSVENAGFLRNQTFDFHEGLNSIIGGKGVGKSLAVEFLRFGLLHPPADPSLFADHSSKLEKQLEPGNSVTIIYETEDGTQFRIRRSFDGISRSGELLTTEECIHLGTDEEYNGSIPAMFPILAYSQTEVIKVSENRNAQLQLIDQFIDIRPYELEISQIRAELAENDKRLNTAIQAKGRLDALRKEIDTLNVRITAINKSLDNPLFERIKQAESKKSQLHIRYGFLEELIRQIQEWREAIIEKRVEELAQIHENDIELTRAQEISSQGCTRVLDVLDSLISELTTGKGRISDVIKDWMPVFDDLSAEYQQLLKEIGGDREAKERERQLLEGRKADLDREVTSCEKLGKDLETILETRKNLLDKLERVYRDYYEIRKAKFDQITEISDGRLQLLLEHAADRSAYEEQLVDLLKSGANAPSVSDRRKIAQGVAPRRLVQMVLDRNALDLANEAEITELWAERAIEKLWSAEDFTEVLALQHNCYPTDVPSIRFCKGANQYGELSELSVGQKCTALLIIALSDGTMPIIIDQPEDALDILSVWEDIAKKLRRGKDSRQFILTTHNSSVAVAADSDQFIVLKAGATSGRVVASGAIDLPEVRKAVIDHLEGGDEPYRLRASKYNLK